MAEAALANSRRDEVHTSDDHLCTIDGQKLLGSGETIVQSRKSRGKNYIG
ncbi:MAG TPA: hypothetical protein VE687_02460 [Stellaceae bacterium]|nr:hypothetical protein [Stellaceae bacterium]